MRVRNLVFGVILGVTLQAGDALCASDGNVGTTSQGQSDLTLNIPELIRIGGFVDHTFGPYSGTGVLEANENIYVSRNKRTAPRNYRVTGTGNAVANSPANAFNVSDGTNLVPYSVSFNDQTGTAGEAALTAGTALTAQSGANFPVGSTTDNSNYHIVFSEANLQAASSGAYTGSLLLLVAPE